jgi:hypothetical protein
MILYYRLMTKWSGLGDSMELSRMGLSQEPYEEEDTDYCFVYDMAKSRGGWYSDGSCIELPFS